MKIQGRKAVRVASRILFAAAANASRPFGLYTSLIFSSYISYQLNSGSSLVSFTALSRARYAFGGFREGHVSGPSLTMYLTV